MSDKIPSFCVPKDDQFDCMDSCKKCKSNNLTYSKSWATHKKESIYGNIVIVGQMIFCNDCKAYTDYTKMFSFD